MKKTLVICALAMSAFADLVQFASPLDVEQTTQKARQIIEQKGMKIFDVFEHSELAKQAGLDMAQTNVVVFGAPKVGTLLMQCAPKMALELPLKFLIQNDGEKTILAYEDIAQVAKRYDAQGCEIVQKMSAAQEKLAKAVVGKE